MVSFVFAHPDAAMVYFAYGVAGVLILLSGAFVLLTGRFLVDLIRPRSLRQPPTTLGGRTVEALEVAVWALAGILIWYWMASMIVPLGPNR
jgi:hypothetical protein